MAEQAHTMTPAQTQAVLTGDWYEEFVKAGLAKK
jgi:hypothetical protein